MGTVIALEAKRIARKARNSRPPQDQLPLVLSRLLAAGATDFTRIALDAWANRELDPSELLELCSTYAAVAGLETV